MGLVKKKKIDTGKEYCELLEFYKDLNKKVFKDMFFSVLLEPEDMEIINMKSARHERNPMFIGQMGTLYSLCPLKYHEVLNQDLLDFLAKNFRHNVVFIVTNDGFLLYIMIMQTNVEERTSISRFFANHYDELPKYQYFTSEYDPKLEQYKLLTAKTHKNEKPEDIVLTFF
jgi:hypothetical protein